MPSTYQIIKVNKYDEIGSRDITKYFPLPKEHKEKNTRKHAAQGYLIPSHFTTTVYKPSMANPLIQQ